MRCALEGVKTSVLANKRFNPRGTLDSSSTGPGVRGRRRRRMGRGIFPVEFNPSKRTLGILSPVSFLAVRWLDRTSHSVESLQGKFRAALYGRWKKISFLNRPAEKARRGRAGRLFAPMHFKRSFYAANLPAVHHPSNRRFLYPTD